MKIVESFFIDTLDRNTWRVRYTGAVKSFRVSLPDVWSYWLESYFLAHT